MTELQAIDTHGETVVEFTTEELTAHCPFDFGGPDFYDLTLRYMPDGNSVESRSLKFYLQSFRDDELTAEELAATIYTDIVDCIEPKQCYVKLNQATRGGLDEVVEVGDLPLRV